MSLIYVKAACHCGLNGFQVPILTSMLPQGTDMCHCNACRHITGQMFLHIVLMDGPPLSANSGQTPETHESADLSTLAMYKASDKVLRYFCPRCFAHILYDLHQPDQQPTWAVSSGAMERAEGLATIGYHIFVPDTLDGGVADHVRYLNGKAMARYVGWEGSEQVSFGWKAECLSIAAAAKEERLHVYCHCKTISLYLTRPENEPGQAAQEQDPGTTPRFQAGHCFCRSCRLTSGSIFVTYIDVPLGNIFDAANGQSVRLASAKGESTTFSRPKGLVQYASSPGRFRESCGACGANVFSYTKAGVEGEAGKSVVRLHMGLIDEGVNGARAENWVYFDNKIHYGEDAHDKATAEAVQMALGLGTAEVR